MDKKSVLITGTSTGIGRACALYLDQLGYKVFAGIRSEKDRDDIVNSASDRLHPLTLDVTEQDTITEAIRIIKKENDYPLFGLVNNAGIGISGVLEASPLEHVRKVIEVNVIGLFAVTQACMPLLRKSKGRIINIGSSASYFAAAAQSAYCASKFAVRAITDSLRMEMYPFGVEVILVSPGAIESAMWEKNKQYRKFLRENVDPELREVYAMYIKAADRMQNEVKPIPAIEVARVIEKALTSTTPRCVYFVGKDARLSRMLSRIPKRLLNRLFAKSIKTAANRQ